MRSLIEQHRLLEISFPCIFYQLLYKNLVEKQDAPHTSMRTVILIRLPHVILYKFLRKYFIREKPRKSRRKDYDFAAAIVNLDFRGRAW